MARQFQTWNALTITALYTMDEAAKELRVSRWLQDFIQRHPYYRMVGRKKLFTSEDVARLIGALPCPGSPPRKGKTPYWYIRGKYLGIALDDSTGATEERAARRIIKTWREQAERGEFRKQPS